jgi:hypothetical protein
VLGNVRSEPFRTTALQGTSSDVPVTMSAMLRTFIIKLCYRSASAHMKAPDEHPSVEKILEF